MKLHTWMVENGRTATWLAERTELSVSYVSRLIDGKRSPSMVACSRIAVATGGEVSANDFVPVPKKKAKKHSQHPAIADAA